MTPGFFVARRLTAPAKKRAYPLRVLESTRDTVTLPATEGTTSPGQWGLFYDGHGHVTISGTPTVDAKAVTWRVVRGTPPPAGTRVAWSGINRPTPGAAGLRAHDHRFATPAGSAPAWFIGAKPGEERPVWAVHVYGLGSTRAGVLRSVFIASRMGLPSVLPTYRNSYEGPKFGDGRPHLGQSEVHDIAAVLDELSVTGRERFILFGWSMGAQIVLALAADPKYADRIDRLVLESPVLDWRSTLEHNVQRVRLPRVVGREAAVWLEQPPLHRVTCLSKALDLDAMDWVARADEVPQPVLLLHSEKDRFAPFSASEAFAGRAGDVTLVNTGGGHTSGWNVNPSLWSSRTSDFLVRDQF